MSPVGAIQNQQKKSSPPTKDSKTPRNEKDDGEDLENIGKRVGKAQGCASGYRSKTRHTCMVGSPRFGCCLFLPSLILNLHLQYLNMSGASFFAGAHHFVANNSTFIESQTVSEMFTKGIC